MILMKISCSSLFQFMPHILPIVSIIPPKLTSIGANKVVSKVRAGDKVTKNVTGAEGLAMLKK